MMPPRHEIKFQGWQALSRLLTGYLFISHACFVLLDPLSASARSMMPLGPVIAWVMAVQMICAGMVIWQAFDREWRECRWAGIPWLVLASCALMRLAGSVLSTTDSPFQSFAYFVLIGLCLFGAVNAARTT